MILRECKNEPDLRHTLKNVVEYVHMRYLIPEYVVDIRVRMVEFRMEVNALARQVGQEPAVSMVSEHKSTHK